MEINDSLVEFTEGNNFELIYSIKAGPIFTVKNASLNLPLDYDQTDFIVIEKKLKKTIGKNYSLNRLNKIAKEVEKLTFKNDYEFLNASFKETILENNIFDLIFEIKEFKKRYLKQVNVLGNNITQEKVIRDNLEVDEGDPFNELLLAKSINNLKALNIWKCRIELVSMKKIKKFKYNCRGKTNR